MEEIFRKDHFGRTIYLAKNNKVFETEAKGKKNFQGMEMTCGEKTEKDVFTVQLNFFVTEDIVCDSFGFRLGIDCCMAKYPEWDLKYFPTAVRCEKNGFWAIFESPLGKKWRCALAIISYRGRMNTRSGTMTSDIGSIQRRSIF